MKEQLIEHVPLFAGLTDAEQSTLFNEFTAGECEAGTVLFKAGEEAEALYLVTEGFVGLTTQTGEQLATVGAGSMLGDASLLRAIAHDVNAVALSPLKYWQLSDRTLRQLILRNPAIGLKLCDNFGGKLPQMEEYLIQRLGRTPAFEGLPSPTLRAVARQLRRGKLQAGDFLHRAGEVPPGLILVESGEVALQPEQLDPPSDQPDEVVPVQTAGSLFGALSLLTGKPCLQDAVATQETNLWLLSAEDFKWLSAQHPGLRRSLARRVRSPLSQLDQAQALVQLGQAPLFAEVPIEVQQALVAQLVLHHAPAGERVYSIGEAADALYLVEVGEVALTGENVHGAVEERARIGSGGHFGESSFLNRQIRTENATALRDTNLWVLTRADFDQLVRQNPNLAKALNEESDRRRTAGVQTDNLDRFRHFALFADLEQTELQQVVECLQPMRYLAGEWIYQPGSPADTLFLLARGYVRIQPERGESWLIESGAIFGERALLTDRPHDTSASAEADVALWLLHKDRFEQLMNRFPRLATALTRYLGQQLESVPSEPEMARNGGEPLPVTAHAPRTATGEPSTASKPRGPQPAQEPASPEYRGFARMSTAAKLRLVVLVSLLLWLLAAAASIVWRALSSALTGHSMLVSDVVSSWAQV